MKTIRIISHPVLLISSFLLVIISGEHLGGFYLLYILFGLPHGALHSVLAVIGIAMLVFGLYKFKRQFITVLEPLLNLVGAICLFLSLYLFFYRDNERYNYSTFDQGVPMFMLSLCGLLMTVFVVYNLNQLRRLIF